MLRFRDAEGLLRWAYALAERPVVNTSTTFQSGNLNDRRPMLPPHELTVWERHAQAALVRAYVERLASPLPAFAVCMYGLSDRHEPLLKVTDWLIDTLRTGGSRRAHELMVVQYASSGTGIGEIRRLLACSKRAALERRRRGVRRAGHHPLATVRRDREPQRTFATLGNRRRIDRLRARVEPRDDRVCYNGPARRRLVLAIALAPPRAGFFVPQSSTCP